MHSGMLGTVSYVDLNIETFLLLCVDSHLVALSFCLTDLKTHTDLNKHFGLFQLLSLSLSLSHTYSVHLCCVCVCVCVCVSREGSGEVGQAEGKWGDRGREASPVRISIIDKHVAIRGD